MLEGRDLWFRYRPDLPWVVQGADLQLQPEEVLGLRGPSGCGKTTLGRLLAGFIQPSRGTVLVEGNPLPRRGRSPVQLVLQHPELAVNPRWRLGQILSEGGPPDPELLAALSIDGGWLERYPNELSGGELQRIALARALLARPSYVVADEISAMLDAITQAQLWSVLLRRVRSNGIGLVAISHDQDLLAVVADRVVDLEPELIEA